MTASSQSTAGVIQNLPALTSAQVSPTAMVEAPILPTTTANFTRTIAPMPSADTVIAMTTSGFTVLSAKLRRGHRAAGHRHRGQRRQRYALGRPRRAHQRLWRADERHQHRHFADPAADRAGRILPDGQRHPHSAAIRLFRQQVNAQLPLNMAGNVTMSHPHAGGHQQ